MHDYRVLWLIIGLLAGTVILLLLIIGSALLPDVKFEYALAGMTALVLAASASISFLSFKTTAESNRAFLVSPRYETFCVSHGKTDKRQTFEIYLKNIGKHPATEPRIKWALVPASFDSEQTLCRPTAKMLNPVNPNDERSYVIEFPYWFMTHYIPYIVAIVICYRDPILKTEFHQFLAYYVTEEREDKPIQLTEVPEVLADLLRANYVEGQLLKDVNKLNLRLRNGAYDRGPPEETGGQPLD